VVADLAKLSLSQRDYYTNEIARDREEYSSGHGEAPGEWLGGGAASLGLSGQLTTEQFQAMFDGRNPATGELLGAAHTKNGLPAYDLVLRPPKSVALVWAFGGDESVRAVVMAAGTKKAPDLRFRWSGALVWARQGLNL
jgi:conjugative relaxase-like TrwC/TraI family protein